MIIGSLGNFIFMASSLYTKTFISFSRSSSVRWIEHKIIGEKPKLQFDGIDLKQIELSIHLNRFFKVDIPKEKEKLEKYMEEGKVLRLIIGGEKIGNYVITSLNEEHKAFNAIGKVTKMDIKVSLKEYN